MITAEEVKESSEQYQQRFGIVPNKNKLQIYNKLLNFIIDFNFRKDIL